MNKALDGVWLRNAREGHYHRVAEDVYDIQYSQGYWCELPSPEHARVTHPPRGFVSVYTRHLEYRLRFPLDPFVADVLVGYNITLDQLNPKSMRYIIGFRWV